MPSLHMISNGFMLILFALLAACGSSSSSDDEDNEPSAPNAYFIDSGVAGLNYQSDSYQGITNTLGAFEFAPGETTTFSYQGLTIGSIITSSSSRVFTPLDMFAGSDINDDRVINMLVLLQSLDNDQDPSNGIYLYRADDPDVVGNIDLSSLAFNISRTEFANTFQDAITSSTSGYSGFLVVNEADAREHFDLTLSGINAEFSLLGTWIERNDNGEIRYKHTYTEDGNMQAVEYGGCLRTSEDASHSPTLAWVERNCNKSNGAYTYEYADKTISIFKNDTQVDTCYVLSSNKIAYNSTCTTDSLIHLERVVESLSDVIIEDNYRLVNPDSSEYADVTFDVISGTGSSTYHSKSGTESADLSNVAISSSAISYDYEITSGADAGDTDSETLTLRSSNDSIQGALATDSASENDTQLLIPNYNPSYAATITKINGPTYAVYNGVTGKCKGLLRFETVYGPDSGDLSNIYRRSTSSDEICSYTDISSEQDSTYEILSGGLISMNIDNEYCWPVSLNVTGENGLYVLAACSKNGDTTFAYEYWYSL